MNDVSEACTIGNDNNHRPVYRVPKRISTRPGALFGVFSFFPTREFVRRNDMHYKVVDARVLRNPRVYLYSARAT